MSREYRSEESDHQDRKEPSLKDALMPATTPRPESAVRAPRAARHEKDDSGGRSGLEDALLPDDHRPGTGRSAARQTPKPEKPKRKEKKARSSQPAAEEAPVSSKLVPILLGAAVILGFVGVFFLGQASVNQGATPGSPAADGSSTGAAPEAPAPAPRPTPDFDDPGPMSLAAMQEKKLIIDVHEHIESLEQAPLYLAAMDKLGIQTMCLMGSSKFTLTLNESFGFTEYDENNEELMKIVAAYPGRFEAWPTINPEDPEKLSKIQDLVARGATGVKVYIGHGYVTKAHTYMFHPIAMDDPGMLPFYAWCEENYVPLMLHVNPYAEKVGFAQEFIAVLSQFPDMKVIAPHFILSSVYNPRMEELLDTFPNLYTDVSFGDFFMAKRIDYISRHPSKFRRLFEKYPDRFMFAADLVMIKGRAENWALDQIETYLNMLSASTYTSPAIPDKKLTGLDLSDELLSRVLFRNYLAFKAHRPSGTVINREVNWSNMNQKPVERAPGQAFPPKSKSDSGE